MFPRSSQQMPGDTAQELAASRKSGAVVGFDTCTETARIVSRS